MNPPSNALALSRLAIRGLIGLNALYAAAIGLLLVATLAYPKFLFDALIGLDGGEHWQVRATLRGVVVLGLAGAYAIHRVLRELQAIVETVRSGDPFIVGNAQRLQRIAWWVLAGEGLRVGVAGLVWSAAQFVPSINNIDVGFSFAPWLAVLLLFVLARVFDHGAHLRADLDGTV
ncbi:DUF2975 domain-containing protein [Permianibacter sp. IMCC34836]|uniref:DUF2975 domain-containing protein n=1 Tax=Permianibacter fluminis TaxID=2738515 RepID=UPI001556E137|nr:DUF2975 domain-containing protein [Permianibacter fluminis]NQD37765.1 DUF2975 domain-containing protein [Permianibacter fluminis]